MAAQALDKLEKEIYPEERLGSSVGVFALGREDGPVSSVLPDSRFEIIQRSEGSFFVDTRDSRPVELDNEEIFEKAKKEVAKNIGIATYLQAKGMIVEGDSKIRRLVTAPLTARANADDIAKLSDIERSFEKGGKKTEWCFQKLDRKRDAEEELIGSVEEHGRPFLYVYGNGDVAYLGDQKEARLKTRKLATDLERVESDGSGPGFLYSLFLPKSVLKDLKGINRSKELAKALRDVGEDFDIVPDFNPELLGMGLGNYLDFIDYSDGVKPLKKETDWKKIAIGGGILVLALGAAYAAWWLSGDHEAPKVHRVDYKSIVKKGEKQEITAVIEEKNPADSIKLELNGSSLDVPLAENSGNDTVVYRLSFDPSTISVKEGYLTGNLTVTDKYGNKATGYPVHSNWRLIKFLANLKEPDVSDLRTDRTALGKYQISAQITDDSSFSAFLQLLNGTEIPMSKDDGRYTADISTLADLDFILKAIDKYNMSSSFPGAIRIVGRDKFEMWLPSDFSKDRSLGLFDYSSLFRQLFEEGKFDDLRLALKISELNGSAVPKNLAYRIFDQIERAQGLQSSERESLVRDALTNLDRLQIYNLKRIDSIWLETNATRYGFRDLAGLGRALQFSEGSDVSLNFENLLCYSALADTGHYFPQIFKYPYEAKYLSVQVGDAIYFFDIDKIKGKDYVWDGMIVPFCQWRFGKLEDGSFKSLDYKFKDGELAKLAKWSHPAVVDAAARSMYPFDELMDHDLLGFDSTRLFHDGRFADALERGVKSMRSDSTIGNSPFGYIYQLLLNDRTKITPDLVRKIISGEIKIIPIEAERHEVSVYSTLRATPQESWPSSYDDYKRGLLEDTRTNDIDIYLIKGFPVALNVKDIPINPNFEVQGQATPYYSKIIGAMLNRPTVVLDAPYSNSPGIGSHDEPFVVGKDGSLIGFWYRLDKFLDDYNVEKNPNANDYWKTNRSWIKLYIVSDRKYNRFEQQDLSKILNE
jgi:hypothetical protein